MSISPPGDIVLDVVNAANPEQKLAITRRLEQMAKYGKVVGSGFGDLMKKTISINDITNTATRPVAQPPAKNNSHEVYSKLEGVVLQGMISNMMPKQESKLFGSGLAGNYWKSFMSEAIANKIAEGGGVGIAAAMDPSVNSQRVAKAERLGSSKIGMSYEKQFIEKLMSASLTIKETAKVRNAGDV